MDLEFQSADVLRQGRHMKRLQKPPNKALYLLQAEAIQKLREPVIDFHPT